MEYNEELNETFLEYHDEVKIYGGTALYDHIKDTYSIIDYDILVYYDDELDEEFDVAYYQNCDKNTCIFYDRLYVINYPAPNKRQEMLETLNNMICDNHI